MCKSPLAFGVEVVLHVPYCAGIPGGGVACHLLLLIAPFGELLPGNGQNALCVKRRKKVWYSGPSILYCTSMYLLILYSMYTKSGTFCHTTLKFSC